MITVDDETAKLFHFQTILAAFILGTGPFVVQSLVQFGIPIGTLRLGFWINLALHLYIIWALYYARSGIRQALRGNDNLMGPVGLKFAEYWPWISMVLVVGNWLLTVILAGAERF